jgi:hypothetical protein
VPGGGFNHPDISSGINAKGPIGIQVRAGRVFGGFKSFLDECLVSGDFFMSFSPL